MASPATVGQFNAPMLGKKPRKTGPSTFLGGGAGDFFLGHKQVGFIKVAVTVVAGRCFTWRRSTGS